MELQTTPDRRRLPTSDFRRAFRDMVWSSLFHYFLDAVFAGAARFEGAVDVSGAAVLAARLEGAVFSGAAVVAPSPREGSTSPPLDVSIFDNFAAAVCAALRPIPPSPLEKVQLHLPWPGDDLERLKKIRNHRGLRHYHYGGLRVRGQHTKTTGRRGKTVGVSKKR